VDFVTQSHNLLDHGFSKLDTAMIECHSDAHTFYVTPPPLRRLTP
jgi:hypothetical protein